MYFSKLVLQSGNIISVPTTRRRRVPCLEYEEKNFSSRIRGGQKEWCVVDGELKARMAPCKSEKFGKEGDGEITIDWIMYEELE